MSRPNWLRCTLRVGYPLVALMAACLVFAYPSCASAGREPAMALSDAAGSAAMEPLLVLASLMLIVLACASDSQPRERIATEDLLGIAGAAAGSLAPQAAAQWVLGIALRLLSMEAGAFWAVDTGEEKVTLVARSGRDGLLRDVSELPIGEDLLISRVISSGRAVFGAIPGGLRGRCRVVSEEAHTVAVVPVRVQGRCAGAITLASSRVLRPTVEDKRLFACVARQLAVALESSILHEQSGRAQEFLASVVDNLPVGVLVVDAERMCVLHANEMAKRLLCAARGCDEEPTGRSLSEILPADSSRKLSERCRQAAEAGNALHEDHCEVLLPDGQVAYWDCHIAPFTTEHERAKSLLVVLRDATELVHMHTELAECMAVDIISSGENSAQYTSLQAIINTIPEGIIIVKAPDSRPVMSNRAASELLGRSLDPLSPAEKLPEIYEWHSASGELYDFEELPATRAVALGEQVTDEEVIVHRPDGSTVSLSVSAEPIREVGGNVIAAVATFHDVTRIREHARNIEEAYEREHTIAQALQKGLLTEPPERVGVLEIAALYRPALEEAELGGDFYDAFPLNARKLAVVIGDVSGKGLDAAVQLAAVKYNLRSYAHRAGGPALALKRTNDALCRDTAVEGFVTLFFGVIDVQTSKMVWANAGHEPPLVRRGDSTIEELWPTGRALSVMTDSSYEERETELVYNDALMLYTDGLSEARTENGILSHEGLAEIFLRVNIKQASTAVDEVFSIVFESAGRLRDDVAIMLVRIAGRRPAARPKPTEEPVEVPAAWV